MPPVLSRGGAASKLSATEPASVWAPSPETSCQQRERRGRSEGTKQTLEGEGSGPKDPEQVPHTTVKSGEVHTNFYITASAFMDDYVLKKLCDVCQFPLRKVGQEL